MLPRKKSSPRFVAIETLRLLEESRKPVDTIFARVLNEHPLENNDRQLANNIIYGLLRNRQTVDRMLQQLCRQPLKKLKPFIHQALRVGLFQIFFLDRIPESAAVNESVKAVQAARLPKKLQGFVNGVLRNSIRKGDDLLRFVNSEDNPVLNHPDWLCRRWEKRYGRETTIRICRNNNNLPALTLQINRCKTDLNDVLTRFHEHGIRAKAGSYCEDSLILHDFHGRVTRLPGFAEGLFQVQDQGATLLAKLLSPMIKGGEYLDGCAGVGGKTSVLFQLAHPVQANISAVEPDSGRQEKFRENMGRLHPELSIPLFKGSLEEFSAATDKRFHGILLDVPCSGTGVIGRHPDIRWNRRIDDLNRFQQTQLLLLQTAAGLLQGGGLLVYGTCSIEGEENEQVIQSFLADDATFSLEDCTSHLPAEARDCVKNGCFSPLPGSETDGFFGARLRKSL